MELALNSTNINKMLRQNCLGGNHPSCMSAVGFQDRQRLISINDGAYHITRVTKMLQFHNIKVMSSDVICLNR
jgi:hypothetical protein